MSEEQDAEIKTIRERSIKLNLSTADIERLYEKAGLVGLTPSELLENFIGDLVDGTYSNGSDERMYANKWFDRCGFSMGFGEISFLQWMITCSDVDVVAEDWLLLKDLEEEVEPDEYDKADMESLKEDINNLFSEYLENKNAVKNSTLDSEMQKVIKWYEEKRSLCAAPNLGEHDYQEDDENEAEC